MMRKCIEVSRNVAAYLYSAMHAPDAAGREDRNASRVGQSQ